MQTYSPTAETIEAASHVHTSYVFSYVMAAIYIVVAGIYVIINLYANVQTKIAYRSKIQDILQENAIVIGLTSILYVLLAEGLPSWIRWLFYAVCSTLLFNGTHLILTKRDYENQSRVHSTQFLSSAYRLGLVLTPFIMLTGLIGHFVPLSTAIVAFVVGTLALIALVYTTYVSIKYGRDRAIRPNIYVTLIILAIPWAIYPIIYLLSPVIASVITFDSAQIAYIVLDIFSKLLYGVVLLVGATQSDKANAYKFGLSNRDPSYQKV